MSNDVTEKQGWYVSYLSAPDEVSSIFDAMVGIEGGEETAIVRDGLHLILNGDWREVFNSCETWEEAEAVFFDNIEHRSFWSEDI